MTSYNTNPILPSALSEAPEALGPCSVDNQQVLYHLSIIKANRRGLIDKEKMFKKKYRKYNKILNRSMWLNACSSGISIATGISSVASFVTFIGLPVSIPLGEASLTGVIASGIISVLTKKYQRNLRK